MPRRTIFPGQLHYVALPSTANGIPSHPCSGLIVETVSVPRRVRGRGQVVAVRPAGGYDISYQRLDVPVALLTNVDDLPAEIRREMTRKHRNRMDELNTEMENELQRIRDAQRSAMPDLREQAAAIAALASNTESLMEGDRRPNSLQLTTLTVGDTLTVEVAAKALPTPSVVSTPSPLVATAIAQAVGASQIDLSRAVLTVRRPGSRRAKLEMTTVEMVALRDALSQAIYAMASKALSANATGRFTAALENAALPPVPMALREYPPSHHSDPNRERPSRQEIRALEDDAVAEGALPEVVLPEAPAQPDEPGEGDQGEAVTDPSCTAVEGCRCADCVARDVRVNILRPRGRPRAISRSAAEALDRLFDMSDPSDGAVVAPEGVMVVEVDNRPLAFETVRL